MKKSFLVQGFITLLMICCTAQVKAQNSSSPTSDDSTRGYQPGDHELLISPTATTMPKGTAYFTSYELFLLNFGYSFTDNFQVGVFSLFPFTSDFVNTLSVGAKYRLYENDKLSFAATTVYLPDAQLFNLGGVGTYRTEKFTGNLSLSYSRVDGSSGLTTIAGGQWILSDRFSPIGEYVHQSVTLDDFDDATGSTGIIFVGGRWIADRMSFDFGGFRPTEETGNLLLIPYIKGTIIF